MEIEEVYQTKTLLEHILDEPNMYIGSIEKIKEVLISFLSIIYGIHLCNIYIQNLWVYDADQDKLVYREISYVPGLYKIFDEILVNAADNKQRDSKMKLIKVNISKYDFLALFQFS